MEPQRKILRPPAITHLYRGIPAVRSWSKYQETDKRWSLCGIRNKFPRDGADLESNEGRLLASEDPQASNCQFCAALARL